MLAPRTWKELGLLALFLSDNLQVQQGLELTDRKMAEKISTSEWLAAA